MKRTASFLPRAPKPQAPRTEPYQHGAHVSVWYRSHAWVVTGQRDGKELHLERPSVLWGKKVSTWIKTRTARGIC